MRRKVSVLFSSPLLVGAMVLFAPPSLGASTAYTVQDLGTLPGDYASVATGINQFGDVVGWSMGSTGNRAFVYRDGTGMTVLPAPTGRPVTAARAINDNGVVVGTASVDRSDAGHAVRWQAGIATDLGTLPGGYFSEALDVNTNGVIVGSSSAEGSGLVAARHAFRYTDATGVVDLTPTADWADAAGINDAGQVTGAREYQAYLLTGSTFTNIGLAFGGANSFGTAINATGQVAGHVISADGNAERIFRYTAGVATILGGMGEYNRALGINAAGDVVGEGVPVLGPPYGIQGFLYTDANGMQALNQLIDPASGWFILAAFGINDSGQIVGYASGPSGQRAIRLIPGSATPTAPAAPTGLTGQAAYGLVRLTWTDHATNEQGFRVQRALGTNGTFVLIGQVAANVTIFTDATARAGKTYRYRVQAYNAVGVSAWSNTVSIRVRR